MNFFALTIKFFSCVDTDQCFFNVNTMFWNGIIVYVLMEIFTLQDWPAASIYRQFFVFPTHIQFSTKINRP